MPRELLPNSTQIPDVILDFWLSELSGAELKVVLYVARRTYGFGKASDNISLNQMAEGIRRRDGTPLDRGTGLSRSTVKTTCAQLVERGILLKTSNVSEKTGEFEESTYQLNLDWTLSDGNDEPQGGVGRKSAHVGQKPIGGVGRKLAQGGPKNRRGVGRKSALQETDQQETVLQETAARVEAPGVNQEPAAALLNELLSQELNRSDTIRLVREKPGECRRQLEYLSFLIRTRFKFRSSKGAYLRRAIEDGYAPPVGYVETTKVEALQAEEQARRRAQRVSSASNRTRLREAMARLEIEHPGAFMDFTAYVERKKQEAVSKPILNKAPEVKERLLKTFDTEGYRLTLFVDYFRHNRCPVPELQEWIASQPTNDLPAASEQASV